MLVLVYKKTLVFKVLRLRECWLRKKKQFTVVVVRWCVEMAQACDIMLIKKKKRCRLRDEAVHLGLKRSAMYHACHGCFCSQSREIPKNLVMHQEEVLQLDWGCSTSPCWLLLWEKAGLKHVLHWRRLKRNLSKECWVVVSACITCVEIFYVHCFAYLEKLSEAKYIPNSFTAGLNWCYWNFTKSTKR